MQGWKASHRAAMLKAAPGSGFYQPPAAVGACGSTRGRAAHSSAPEVIACAAASPARGPQRLCFMDVFMSHSCVKAQLCKASACLGCCRVPGTRLNLSIPEQQGQGRRKVAMKRYSPAECCLLSPTKYFAAGPSFAPAPCQGGCEHPSGIPASGWQCLAGKHPG